jgi:hypothetical protein
MRLPQTDAKVRVFIRGMPPRPPRSSHRQGRANLPRNFWTG